MSEVNNTVSGGMLVSNRDTAKMFLFNNDFITGQVNNSDYDPLTIPGGTLMGRIASSGLLVPLTSGASDGSQFPVGILAADYTIEDGATSNVRICVSGTVNEDMIILQGSNTLETVISSKRLRDRIASDTVGILLESVDQLGQYDNPQ